MKIAFVGASGYGNVGDDTYPIVFRSHLAGHELLFFNSDLPPEMPAGIGLLVFGGGGIIHNAGAPERGAESPHFIAMKFYLEWARAAGVPWGFSSCGVQFSDEAERADFDIAELGPWVPYLREARFITVRSTFCKSVIDRLASRTDTRFFPDAAYLFTHESVASLKSRKDDRRQFTIIPAGAVDVRHAFIQHMIRPYDRAPGWRMVWLNMGAMVDANGNFENARRLYPDSTIIEQPTPQEALAQIAASSFVVTGRYHGMVFARTCGVPFYVHTVAPSKIQHEDFAVDPAGAIGHIKVLREFVTQLTAGA